MYIYIYIYIHYEYMHLVLHLYEVVFRVSDGPVVPNGQVFQRLHQAALHVAGLGRLDRSVNQPLAPAHRVEKELRRRKASVKGVCDESFVGGLARVALRTHEKRAIRRLGLRVTLLELIRA